MDTARPSSALLPPKKAWRFPCDDADCIARGLVEDGPIGRGVAHRWSLSQQRGDRWADFVLGLTAEERAVVSKFVLGVEA